MLDLPEKSPPFLAVYVFYDNNEVVFRIQPIVTEVPGETTERAYSPSEVSSISPCPVRPGISRVRPIGQ